MKLKQLVTSGALAAAVLTLGAAQAESKPLGDPSSWTRVGAAGIFGVFGQANLHFVSSNATTLAGSPTEDELNRLLEERTVGDVSRADRAKSIAQVDEVLSEFQEKLNVFLPAWIASGNRLDGKPLNARGRSWDRHEDNERLRAVKSGNCRKVALALLAQDKVLLEKCKGLLFDRLVERLRFPEPRLEEREAKILFEKWAMSRWLRCLTEAERKILFTWQFYVVEQEKRPWMKVAQAYDEVAVDAESVFLGVEKNVQGRLRQKMAGVEKVFADFESQSADAADFIEAWYKKAVAAGYVPGKDDERLLAKARFSKTPWTGHANVVFAAGFSGRKVKIHGKVSAQELKEAADVLTGGLGFDEKTHFDLEMDEVDVQTLRDALASFPVRQLRGVLIRGDGAKGIDLSCLAECKTLQSVELQDCKVEACASLSKCETLGSFSAKNSMLGDLKYLAGCGTLMRVSLDGCSFAGLDRLWASEQLRELAVPNSKEVVDLSVVRKLGRLDELEITGCSVTNFAALKDHPSLRWLKMEHLKGGVDSLSVLAGNERLASVDYLKSDFPPSAYAEFARARRRKEYGDNPERMLGESVKDRDLAEIRDLCKGGLRTDDALSEFEFLSETDLEIFRLLVPKASEQSLSEQLKRCVSMFGYGHYLSRTPSFVPTNRMEIVELLLKGGACPDEAMGEMAHPSAEDMEIFKVMLAKTSKKTLTDLLQKNIRSFGNDLRRARDVGHLADRLVVVRLLLESGADPNVKNFFGKTPLGNAIESDGDMELVRVLLDHGADASLLYPKFEVVRSLYQGRENLWGTNRYELVELLLAHGLDVNARGRFGKTPLGELVFFGGRGESHDLKMAELLLGHGADPNVGQGRNQGSATDMAFERYDAKELLDLLVKHGGKVSDEAKKRKEERQGEENEDVRHDEDRRRRRRLREEPGQGHGGRSDQIRAENDRFHAEMRECRDPESRRRLMEEHRERMRQLRESR